MRGKHKLLPKNTISAKKKPSYPKVKVPSKDPKYTPSEKEEYLSAAIQANKYLSLKAQTIPANYKDILIRDGVVLIENVIPEKLINDFLDDCKDLSGNHELIVGLEDAEPYNVPVNLINSLNLLKISKQKTLKELLKFIDQKMKSIFENSTPIKNETFFRCKGSGSSTVEHCDFFHYKTKIFFNEKATEESVPVFYT